MAETKEPAALLNEFMDRSSSKGLLPSLTFNLTRRCNLDCVHCYRAPERSHRVEELTTAEWIDLAYQAERLGTMVLVLSGGEPLVRPDWRELVAEFDAMGFAQHIFTNATYIDEDAARFLGEHRIYRIQVSLLGATAQVHDALTKVPGSFAKTTKAIELLKDQGLIVDVVYTVMRQNTQDVPAFISLVKAMGANPMLGLHVYAGFEGEVGLLDLNASDEALVQVMAVAAKEGVQTTSLDIECPDPRQVDLDMTLCGAGNKTITVNADGTVTPCVTWPLVVGNVRHQTLAEIWKNSPQLAEIRAYRHADAKVCAACDLAPWCSHCPAAAILEGKTALDPSVVDCRVARLAKKASENKAPVLEVDGLFRKP